MLTIKKATENRVNESVGWSEPAPVPSGGIGETTADSAADSADNSASNSAGDHAGTGETHSHAIPEPVYQLQSSITPFFVAASSNPIFTEIAHFRRLFCYLVL